MEWSFSQRSSFRQISLVPTDIGFMMSFTYHMLQFFIGRQPSGHSYNISAKACLKLIKPKTVAERLPLKRALLHGCSLGQNNSAYLKDTWIFLPACSKQYSSLYRAMEVETCPLKLWEHAILEGYQVFREVMRNEGGMVIGDRQARCISYGGK